MTSLLNLPDNCLNKIAEHSSLSSLISLQLVSKKANSVTNPIKEQYESYYKEMKQWINTCLEEHGVCLYMINDNINAVNNPGTNMGNMIGLYISYIKDEEDEVDPHFYIPIIRFYKEDNEIEPGPKANLSIKQQNILINVDPFVFEQMLIYALDKLEIYISANDVFTGFPWLQPEKIKGKLIECLSTRPKFELSKLEGKKGGKTRKKTEYVKYGDKKYPLKTGSRGGKYIIVNDRKIYI